MDPTGDYYGSANGNVFRSRAEIGDDSHFAVIPSNGFAHDGFSDSVFGFRLAQPLKQFYAIRIGIGVAMSNIHFIVIMQELDCESESIIKSASLLLQRVLKVTDIVTVPVPSYTIILICLLFRIDQWLHALVIRTLWLY